MKKYIALLLAALSFNVGFLFSMKTRSVKIEPGFRGYRPWLSPQAERTLYESLKKFSQRLDSRRLTDKQLEYLHGSLLCTRSHIIEALVAWQQAEDPQLKRDIFKTIKDALLSNLKDISPASKYESLVEHDGLNHGGLNHNGLNVVDNAFKVGSISQNGKEITEDQGAHDLTFLVNSYQWIRRNHLIKRQLGADFIFNVLELLGNKSILEKTL